MKGLLVLALTLCVAPAAAAQTLTAADSAGIFATAHNYIDG